MIERLQKILSSYGVASRRQAEEMIRQGRVSCNGAVCSLGQTADPETDTILVDDKPLPNLEERVYILLHKPRGYVTTLSDEKGRRNAAELVRDCGVRVYPVGRLDMDSEGLLLFTNDGDLAYKLTHPTNEVPKTYMVKIEGTMTEKDLNPIRSGIELDGVLTKKCKAHIVETHKDYTKVHITITEGKNRQVRRMFEAIGKNVAFLKRVSIGKLKLSGLDRGEVRELTEMEVAYLQNL